MIMNKNMGHRCISLNLLVYALPLMKDKAYIFAKNLVHLNNFLSELLWCEQYVVFAFLWKDFFFRLQSLLTFTILIILWFIYLEAWKILMLLRILYSDMLRISVIFYLQILLSGYFHKWWCLAASKEEQHIVETSLSWAAFTLLSCNIQYSRHL